MAKTTQPSAADEAKARFKAALDAKNAKRQASEKSGTDAQASNVVGSQADGAKPRMFRRKAGG